MIDFDEVLAEVVSELPDIVINVNKTESVRFYWGTGADLPTFLKTLGDKSVPLIWSVSKADAETEIEGLWERNAELNICALETRFDLLNTTRITEGYSFKQVLFPILKNLVRGIELSGNISIEPGTMTKFKRPNYTVGNKNGVNEVWDVLQVTFTAQFSKQEC